MFIYNVYLGRKNAGNFGKKLVSRNTLGESAEKSEIRKPSVLFCTFRENIVMIDYKQIITIEPGKRGGKPTIRGMRISVNDILSWLASGMSISDIIADYDELTQEDIFAVLSYAADRENKIFQIAV